jgi:hypothetical protein
MGRRFVGFWFGAALFALVAPPGRAGDGAERVHHYAVVVTGPAFNKGLDACYWGVNQQIRSMLTAYGYPDEAVYCLCDQGPTRGAGILGRSTLANVRKIFRHLSKVLEENDHLLVFMVGHGSPSDGDFVYVLNNGRLTSAELRALLDAVPTRNVTIALSPCFSGGFIPKLSGPGRVICTSTNDAETNATAWAEAFTEALLFRKRGEHSGDELNRRVSIKQAYNVALDATVKRYRGNTREHPLLDDNGDGVGHFGKAAVVDGDGGLAAKRFLGDEGRRLIISPEAVEKLRRLNAGLVLCDLARAQRIFADEGVYLGNLGGYEDDVGANSTRREDHLAWARRQPPHVVADNLVTKYLLQFDRQARQARASAERFYAQSSARLASYGINLGEYSASGTNAGVYLDWAKGQTDATLREHLEARVRALLAGASDPPSKTRAKR